jgi:hypothetical protein
MKAGAALKAFAYEKHQRVWVPGDEFPEPEDEEHEDSEGYRTEGSEGFYTLVRVPGKLPPPPLPPLSRDIEEVRAPIDRFYHMPVVAVDAECGLLPSVLERRHGHELLSDGDGESICQYSGGVLRDLISLARDAAVEAYIAGHDSITSQDIENVARQLGTGYLRGLGPEEIKILHHLEKSKSFDVSQAANLVLLLTRRVLEHSSTDFRVHPALLSAMPAAEPKSA